VGVTNLGEGVPEQLPLSGVGDEDPVARAATNQAVDEIRARFGPGAIGPASLAGSGGRVGTFEPGSQQWGPARED
jgi:hypothetical protein